MDMVIDFHAHILPGLDHGCKDEAESLVQLKSAAAENIDVIVATSHFYPHMHTVEGFLNNRQEAVQKIMYLLSGYDEGEMPRVIPGAEVLVCTNMDKMPGLDKLCIEGTDIMLVELPFTKIWDKELVETVVRMHTRNNIHVVLAHADRYSYDAVMELVGHGIDLQLNAESVCKLSKRGLCKKYIATGKVVALGSDVHGVSDAYKNYSKARKLLGTLSAKILEKTMDLLKNHGYDL